MFKGIAFALGACFIWGLIFVVPQFMEGFTSIEVALGRYLFYGMASVLIFLKAKIKRACRYPLSVWFKALYFSFFSSFGYYTFVVLSLRYSSPAMCALVLGISPVTIAFYGNWKQRECSFKTLIIPSILIFFGLVIINAPQFTASESPKAYALGLCCSFLALFSWSWYAVSNAGFLKGHPEVYSSDWSTLLGVSTLIWALFFMIFLGVFFGSHIEIHKYANFDSTLTKFLIGCSILGFLCSWVGAFLWNRASVYLPVSLAGQLTIFETIFGLFFVYLIDGIVPPAMEFLGIVFLLAAIIYGIRTFAKNTQKTLVNT